MTHKRRYNSRFKFLNVNNTIFNTIKKVAKVRGWAQRPGKFELLLWQNWWGWRSIKRIPDQLLSVQSRVQGCQMCQFTFKEPELPASPALISMYVFRKNKNTIYAKTTTTKQFLKSYTRCIVEDGEDVKYSGADEPWNQLDWRWRTAESSGNIGTSLPDHIYCIRLGSFTIKAHASHKNMLIPWCVHANFNH